MENIASGSAEMPVIWVSPPYQAVQIAPCDFPVLAVCPSVSLKM